MRYFLAGCVFFLFFGISNKNSIGQDNASNQSLTLMFVGDVMGHGIQIKSAFNPQTGTFCYDDVFSRMSPIFSMADFAIANLEVTLAGEPYTGFPKFSSPDELVDGLLSAGINVLVTANNHTVDRGKKGITRTIDVLTDKKMPFAGAYKDITQRDSLYPLILEKNGIRLALLNYTYGTNGIPVPEPTVVNLIDTALIRADFLKAKSLGVDEIIAFMHWGLEYQRAPSFQQIWLTQFMQQMGIRIVIGSHPHVLQRMEASFDTDSTEGRVAVYSLGNFVSNQRPRHRNGAAVVVLHIEKEDGKTNISNAGHILFWVQIAKVRGNQQFRVLPVSKVENIPNFFNDDDKAMFDEFIADSRELFLSENYNFPEIKIKEGEWQIPWTTTSHTFPRRVRRIEPWRKHWVYPSNLRF
jgi:poly-gamma-glutamate capsule biosynthesis protein CapA/YwtB (metallophosphatase superfamily)